MMTMIMMIYVNCVLLLQLCYLESWSLEWLSYRHGFPVQLYRLAKGGSGNGGGSITTVTRWCPMACFNVQWCTKCAVMNENMQWWKAVFAMTNKGKVEKSRKIALFGVDD